MTILKPNGLCISIIDPAPDERREWILKAVASAIRWYGGCPDVYKDDGQHLVVLSELLHELAETKTKNASQQ